MELDTLTLPPEILSVNFSNTDTEEETCLSELRKLIDESLNQDIILANETIEIQDDFLIRYLRSRNMNVESAYTRIQHFFSIRNNKHPEIFTNLYPSAVYHVIDNGGAVILKHRDHKGRHIMYIRACNWDFDKVTVDEMLISEMLLGWEMLSFKETQQNGLILILDARGFGIKHARQASPRNIQKYSDLILKATPFKLKGAHVIFAPTLFNMTVSLIKMFLPGKLRRRIHSHGNSTESLHDHISPEILPDTLGGKLSEEEALDHDIVQGLYSPEKDDYYKILHG